MAKFHFCPECRKAFNRNIPVDSIPCSKEHFLVDIDVSVNPDMTYYYAFDSDEVYDRDSMYSHFCELQRTDTDYQEMTFGEYLSMMVSGIFCKEIRIDFVDG